VDFTADFIAQSLLNGESDDCKTRQNADDFKAFAKF
jgi:hypothetical protein